MVESDKFLDVGALPENWQIVDLGDLIHKIVGGGTPFRDNATFWNGNVPWATVKDLKGNKLHDTEEYISQEGLVNSSANLIGKDTLIIATRMALGKAVFFTKDVAINQDLKAIYPKALLDKRFLFHWFNHHSKAIVKLGTGSTVKGIRLEVIKKLKFLLPPISEQQKISEILNSIDEKTDIISELITQTSKLKCGLLSQLLTKGIADTEFKNSKLGEVPVDWQVKKINEISDVVRGSSPRPAGNPDLFDGTFLPWITVAEVTNNHSKYLTHTKKQLTELGSLQTRIIEPNTVLLSNSGATLGVPIILKVQAGANDGIAAFLNLKEVTELFLFYYLQSLTDYFRNQLAPGSGQPNLNTSLIGNTYLPIPTAFEQEKITSILSTLDEKIDILKEKRTTYISLKGFLMQQLLTGKIKVNAYQQSAVA